jgi:hypothetical protein
MLRPPYSPDLAHGDFFLFEKVKFMLVCLFDPMGIVHKEWIPAEQIINIKKGKVFRNRPRWSKRFRVG